MEESKQEGPDIYESESELSSKFNRMIEWWTNSEQNSESSQEVLEPLIKELKKLEMSVCIHQIFSINEDFKEILTENLKYLYIPFYIGDTFSRLSNSLRKNNLLVAKQYFNEFFKILDHYELLTKEIKKQWKGLAENPKFEFSREEKIGQYKEQKQLEERIKNLEKVDDDKERREYFKALCQFYIIKTLVSLRSLNQEFEILEYKEKISKDDKAKEEFEKLQQKPLPSLKYYHIPKQEEKNPYLIQGQQLQQQGKGLCHKCAKLDNKELQGKSAQQIAQEFQERVFQPGISLPNMTLDQFADFFMAQSQEAENKNKEAQLAQQKELENDQDKEYYVEKQRKKDAEWDNWKDENEKGAGNKMGK